MTIFLIIYLSFIYNIEQFKDDTSQNVINPINRIYNLIPNNSTLFYDYLYNPLNYLYNPLDYWLNPYYYNFYSYPIFSTNYYTNQSYNKFRKHGHRHRNRH